MSITALISSAIAGSSCGMMAGKRCLRKSCGVDDPSATAPFNIWLVLGVSDRAVYHVSYFGPPGESESQQKDAETDLRSNGEDEYEREQKTRAPMTKLRQTKGFAGPSPRLSNRRRVRVRPPMPSRIRATDKTSVIVDLAP